MPEVLLLVTVLAVLYGLWVLLDFTFQMIDVWHQRERLSAAEPRRGGAEQAEGKSDC